MLLLSRFSHVRLCATPWTAAYQVPLSMGFSRQEYWSGLPFLVLYKKPAGGQLTEMFSNNSCISQTNTFEARCRVLSQT